MSRPTNTEMIRGVWTAIATPFDRNGAIDFAAFQAHLEQQAAGGVSGIVVSGTTGEAPTLSVDEKLKLITTARKTLPKHVRVMGGTGGNDTARSVELSVAALENGADSLLVVTPPYNKPTLAGLKLHFEAIAAKCDVPICLYHVPGRTAHSLPAKAIAELCAIPRVTAVKEASGDMALFARARQATGRNATFLSGDDPTYLASLAVGASGVISVAANVLPKAFVAMTEAFQSGDPGRALAINEILMPVIDVCLCETNPGPLKAALEIMGLARNQLRLPLAPVAKANYELIGATLKEAQSKLSEMGISR